ncbi:CHAT domain-containing protein [Streptomyces sp. FH025]|uniref:CHAT domain-containing protein n=1 Tax=Streptomyces sp. FH025 TaxID=2815937 RepID=UPI001A9DF3AA|nr:CHAT domain-containing protein [Streptomyces sp. FH025]MBO1416198.1 CHAT domain-containing protein [Streptomyces sp. FH025]
MTEGQSPYPEDHFSGGGGFEGVRLWADAAAGRAELLLPPDPTGPPRIMLDDQDLRDRAIDELDRIEGLLGEGDERRPVLAARLGALLGWRHLQRESEPADRERAIRLLREARSAVPALPAWEMRRAGLALVMLLLPFPRIEATGRAAFGEMIAYQSANAAAFHPDNPAFAEAHALLEELADVPWPAELARRLDLMRTVLGLANGGVDQFFAAMGPMFDALPPDFPFLQQFRVMRDFMPDAASPSDEPAQGPEPEQQPAKSPEVEQRSAKSPAAEQESDERMRAMLLAAINMSVPGSFSQAQADDLADLVRTARVHDTDDPEAPAVDAIAFAMLKFVEAIRDSDLDGLAEAIEQLGRGGEGLPPDNAWHQTISALMPLLLALAPNLGGNQQDRETAERLMAEAVGRFAAESPSAASGAFFGMSRVLAIRVRMDRLVQEEDAEGMEECLAEVRALREAGLPGEVVPISEMVLGDVYQQLGRLRDDPRLVETGLEYSMAAVEALAPLAESVGMLDAWRTSLATIRGGLAKDPELLRAEFEAPQPEPPEGALGRTHAARIRGLARAVQAEITNDRDDLDRAIENLAALRADLDANRGGYGDADLLWSLADLYRRRNDTELDDPAHAAQAMVESFEALAADVLLEATAEHRLLTARNGASRALQAAWWAGSHGQTERAVTMLELGRSMVLQATAVAAEVPELLAARGHRELAEAWREAGAGTEAGGLPSRLRRQALDALGYRAGSGPFEPATLDELKAGLGPSEADALVYLVPGGSAPGMAVIVGPDLEPGVLALPLLAADGRAPLEEYLNVSAERSRLLKEGPGERREEAKEVEERWERALSALADWALPAAVAPVLQGVAERLAANPGRHRGRPGGPRLVLVPCGNLGVVPWHAARLPEGAPHRYVCEIAVLSYAASGREFLRAAARERLSPGGRAVLVADPRLDLTFSEREVLALRDDCYPEAELYGAYVESADPPVAEGTPEEVLGLLPGGPSEAEPVAVLHIASHGTAGVRPTVSALNLALPPGGSPVPDGAPDAGMLTVSRLLDRPSGAAAPAGPLVVLSACETDLSTRDHDEALTLATAFLAAGAKDVVGSRWTARDGATALMMAVFHHRLAVHGRSPADALQDAQRWMLDPGRVAPPDLDPELAREVGQPYLDRLPVWAAFVHQGHPGAAPRPYRENRPYREKPHQEKPHREKEEA